MTGLDWLIIAFALLMGVWGYQQGLIVGALSLGAFAVGAILGSRIGPALLPDGSESPYAPLTALGGAVLIGGMVAVSVETLAYGVRARVIRGQISAAADGAGGAALLAALGLAVAWLFGAVALNAPGATELRQAVQRSAILRGLNEVLPPRSILNALNRVDPRPDITGPGARVGPPDPGLPRDPEVRAAADSIVRVTGTACGLGIAGSGWVVAEDLVVTNAHVVAGEEDTTVSTMDGEERLDADPVHYDPRNDLALLRVSDLAGDPLPVAAAPSSGTAGAVLGYPENGPFEASAARLGATQTAISQDSYGRGPVQRRITSLRGHVRSGNSGGPMVDGAGRVLTTLFAATTSGQAGGFGVPNEIVRASLGRAKGEVDTGPCT